MEPLNNRVYEPVGHCIYCGSTEGLQKEHILPFGLSGTSILPEASCAKCARITGTQERIILRGPMWPVRVYRDLHSRTKHREAPQSYRLTLVREEEEIDISVPLSDYPILLNFPVFPPPAILVPRGYKSRINVYGVALVSFGPHPEEFAKRYGANGIKVSQSIQPVAFARVIAKIAYAMAAAERALDRIEGTPLVLPAILGESEDIGKWVGTATNPTKKHVGVLHRIAIHEDSEKGLLIGEVQLFSDSEAPCYWVVLGRLRRTYARS